MRRFDVGVEEAWTVFCISEVVLVSCLLEFGGFDGLLASKPLSTDIEVVELGGDMT